MPDTPAEDRLLAQLASPCRERHRLDFDGHQMLRSKAQRGAGFPLADIRPVPINGTNSVFPIEHYPRHEATSMGLRAYRGVH
jgi:hypothetical protein